VAWRTRASAAVRGGHTAPSMADDAPGARHA
jgi:hypothetical protein